MMYHYALIMYENSVHVFGSSCEQCGQIGVMVKVRKKRAFGGSRVFLAFSKLSIKPGPAESRSSLAVRTKFFLDRQKRQQMT